MLTSTMCCRRMGMGGVMLTFMLLTVNFDHACTLHCRCSLGSQWRYLKECLPKTVATKSEAGHVNQILWQDTYSWQYWCNKSKDLWTAVVAKAKISLDSGYRCLEAHPRKMSQKEPASLSAALPNLCNFFTVPAWSVWRVCFGTSACTAKITTPLAH